LARGYIIGIVAAERTAAPEHGEANTRDMAWVLADGTKHMIQLNGSNQKRWPTAPARHGAAVPESISAYTEFNSARRIRLRVTPEIKPRAFFKPSIIRGYDESGLSEALTQGTPQIKRSLRYLRILQARLSDRSSAFGNLHPCCGGYRHYGRAASYSPGRPWSLDGAALANKVYEV
jgi:hypothetical protein